MSLTEKVLGVVQNPDFRHPPKSDIPENNWPTMPEAHIAIEIPEQEINLIPHCQYIYRRRANPPINNFSRSPDYEGPWRFWTELSQRALNDPDFLKKLVELNPDFHETVEEYVIKSVDSMGLLGIKDHKIIFNDLLAGFKLYVASTIANGRGSTRGWSGRLDSNVNIFLRESEKNPLHNLEGYDPRFGNTGAAATFLMYISNALMKEKFLGQEWTHYDAAQEFRSRIENFVFSGEFEKAKRFYDNSKFLTRRERLFERDMMREAIESFSSDFNLYGKAYAARGNHILNLMEVFPRVSDTNTNAFDILIRQEFAVRAIRHGLEMEFKFGEKLSELAEQSRRYGSYDNITRVYDADFLEVGLANTHYTLMQDIRRTQSTFDELRKESAADTFIGVRKGVAFVYNEHMQGQAMYYNARNGISPFIKALIDAGYDLGFTIEIKPFGHMAERAIEQNLSSHDNIRKQEGQYLLFGKTINVLPHHRLE